MRCSLGAQRDKGMVRRIGKACVILLVIVCNFPSWARGSADDIAEEAGEAYGRYLTERIEDEMVKQQKEKAKKTLIRGATVGVAARTLRRFRKRKQQERVAFNPGELEGISVLKEGGARVDWSHSGNNLIAFDKKGEDGFFDVYTIKPDGSGETCLTCDHPDLPNRHMGQPAWHPSGRYIVFQAEKKSHKRALMSTATTPGVGVHNDLWLLDVETRRAQLLWEVPTGKRRQRFGVLHPHFSHDGKRLSWSEMYEPSSLRGKGREFGYWKLKVADFSLPQGKPSLSNIREFEPMGPAFYENHGFSPDGGTLVFTSNAGENKRFSNQIYTMDLQDGTILKLTESGYNEHALFSPDGRYLIWITNTGNENKGTDYWIMRPDGSQKTRVTHFNVPGHPHYAGERAVVADASWSPDGTKIAAYYHTGVVLESRIKDKKIILIDVNLPSL